MNKKLEELCNREYIKILLDNTVTLDGYFSIEDLELIIDYLKGENR